MLRFKVNFFYFYYFNTVLVLWLGLSTKNTPVSQQTNGTQPTGLSCVRSNNSTNVESLIVSTKYSNVTIFSTCATGGIQHEV